MVQLQIWVKNMEEKKQIRKQIFAARKAHTDAQIEDWSRMIADRVTTLPEYKDAKRILAYADYNHEVMTGFIIEAAWRDGKEVAMMVMPGVAFDRENHRVGYGGGFYDRFLEKHPCIRRVAVAFEFQMLPEVPTEPTDISPEIIVTEKSAYHLK